MSSVTEVSKIIRLDLSDIPRSEKKEARKEVGDYLLNEVLREVGKGKSPVKGESFRKLTKDYADKEHGGRRTPLLELDGDMLDALRVTDEGGNKLKLGIEGRQAPKADGHNQISGEAKSWAASTDRVKYKRRFIPGRGQDFIPRIQKGIDRILRGYRQEDTTDVGRTEEGQSTPTTTTTTAQDLFSDDVIADLLRDAVRRRDGS